MEREDASPHSLTSHLWEIGNADETDCQGVGGRSDGDGKFGQRCKEGAECDDSDEGIREDVQFHQKPVEQRPEKMTMTDQKYFRALDW